MPVQWLTPLYQNPLVPTKAKRWLLSRASMPHASAGFPSDICPSHTGVLTTDVRSCAPPSPNDTPLLNMSFSQPELHGNEKDRLVPRYACRSPHTLCCVHPRLPSLLVGGSPGCRLLAETRHLLVRWGGLPVNFLCTWEAYRTTKRRGLFVCFCLFGQRGRFTLQGPQGREEVCGCTTPSSRSPQGACTDTGSA